MKRIYKYELLLPLPEVQKPDNFLIHCNCDRCTSLRKAFNNWLSLGIKPSDELKGSLVEGQEYEEGQDFKIDYQINQSGLWKGGYTRFGFDSYLGDGFPDYKRIVAVPLEVSTTVNSIEQSDAVEFANWVDDNFYYEPLLERYISHNYNEQPESHSELYKLFKTDKIIEQPNTQDGKVEDSVIEKIKKFEWYAWDKKGMIAYKKGVPVEDVFILRQDVLSLLTDKPESSEASDAVEFAEWVAKNYVPDFSVINSFKYQWTKRNGGGIVYSGNELYKRFKENNVASQTSTSEPVVSLPCTSSNSIEQYRKAIDDIYNDSKYGRELVIKYFGLQHPQKVN